VVFLYCGQLLYRCIGVCIVGDVLYLRQMVILV